MGGLSEVGRGQKQFSPVDDNDLRMKASAGMRSSMKRSGIKVDFGKRQPGPMPITKLLRIFKNNVFWRRGIPCSARNIDVENDSQLRSRFLLLSQPLEKQPAIVKCVTGQNNFVLRLLKERLNHRVGVSGRNAGDIWARHNQIRNQDSITMTTGDNGSNAECDLSRSERRFLQAVYPCANCCPVFSRNGCERRVRRAATEPPRFDRRR